jgi:hypothetical protein
MSLEQEIAEFLAQSEARKTSIGKRPNSIQPNTNLIESTQPGTLLGNEEPEMESVGDANMAQEILGNAAWSFADEWTLGTLGMAEEYDWLERGADYFLDADASALQESLTTLRDIAVGDKTFISPETGEKYRAGPQTTAGKAAGAVGTVGGFIFGAPMKVVKGVRLGVGGLTRAVTGRESTKQIIEKASKSVDKVVGDDLAGNLLSLNLRSGVARATSLSSKPGGLNRNVNYVEYIQNGIVSTVDDFVASGKITQKMGDDVTNAYMKYIKDRPINTLTDYILGNSSNPRLAYTVGSMVEEALMFGILDGVREAIHVGGSGGKHEYDWTHPMWGGIMGLGFGSMKFMKPRGKSSLGKVDFKSAIKGQLATSTKILQKQSYPQLKASAEMLGADAKVLGLHVVDDVVVAGKKFKFDLTNVEAETTRILDAVGANIDDIAKSDLLREVLAKEANKYGSQLLKWTTKNSWANIKENWPRMLGGATMMNARSIYDMTQGVQVGYDDIAINMMIGAFLNRKGAARRADMFPEQVQRLRSGLHTLELLPRHYIETNPLTRIPTLDPATSSNMNPFASDRFLNDIVKKAEEMGLTTENFDSIDSPVVKSRDGLSADLVGGSVKSATQSGKDLKMFNMFYRFLQGAATKKYVRSIDNITEKDALVLQDMLSSKFGNEAGMKKYLRKVAENVGDRFENELVASTIDLLSIMGIKSGDIKDGNIGRIPEVIVFDDALYKLAENKKLSGLLESFEGIKNETEALNILNKKLNIALQGTVALNRASVRKTDKALIIRDAAQIDALFKTITNREAALNTELGLTKTSSNSFSFDKMGDMMYFMKSRIVNKKVGEFSSMLDRDFKDKADVLSQLLDSGLVMSRNEINTELRLIEGIDQIEIIEGGKPLQNSKLVNEHKMLLSSVLEVLGAKGQYKTTSEPVQIDVSQVNKLRAFLNAKGVNTDPMSLANFATEAVRRITYENFTDSNLNDVDIAVFQSLYHLGSPDLANKFSLMKYGRPGLRKKAVNIIANKLNYEGSDAMSLDIVKRYNEMIDTMIERGKAQGKDESFVVEGDTFTIRNENTLRTIQSVVQDATMKADRTARHSLTEYLMATIGKNNTRDAALTFMSAYPEHTSKLIKLLINTGALELKPGEGKTQKGVYEYYVNQEKWSNQEIQQKIIKLTSKYGVNMDTLESMTNRANKQLESYLDEMYSPGDHKGSITPNQFFESYLPGVTRNPAKMQEYIDLKLFNEVGDFKGFKALNELFDVMQFKRGHETEAWGHMMQLVSNKLQSQTKKVYYFGDGEVRSKDTDLQTYSTPYFNLFDKMNLKYALVEGMTHDWVFHPQFDKLLYQPLDLFQDQSTITNKYDLRMIKQRKAAFVDMLKAKTNIEGFESGIEFIDMPGMKLSLMVSKNNMQDIKLAYNELFTRQLKNAKDAKNEIAEEKLKNFKELVDKAESFDATIHQAMKEIIAESMLTGKNKNLYLDALEWTPEQINKFYVSRQTMFNTMKFKRIDSDLLKAQVLSYDTMTQLAGKSIDIDGVFAARKFLTKKGYGLAVFDDSLPSFDLKVQFEKENGPNSWSKYYGERLTESNVDSITFISKDMANFLAFHYGVPGSRVFKPIISSQGEANLMYGKTAFVYDPKLDNFFKANPKLDILMAASADKLKLYQSKDMNNISQEMLQIEKQNLYTAGSIDKSKIIELPLESIGVQKIPDHYTAAKLSPSVINNYTDFDLSRKIYNDYYSVDLAKNLDNITEMLSNPFMEAELIRQMKSGQATAKLEDLDLLDGAGMHMGMHLEWLNISEYASIDVFGSNAKMNPIKSKFIDSVMAPKSEYYDGQGINRRYGAKSTISQHGGIDLKGTLFNPKTGKIERYGEIMLPDEIGLETIDFVGRNFDVNVINTKTNEIKTAKDIYMELMPGAENLKLEQWNIIKKSNNPLKTLYKTFEQGRLKDYDIAIATMRYPRTRPNDLMYLRLKGFVDPRSGNQAIVNSFDVFHIFEGDYDIDAIDYFWGSSKAFRDNIVKQQKVFVPTVDVSTAKEVIPGVEFSPRNPQTVNKNWQILNSNQRALSGVRGLVQATGSLTKHLDNIIPKNANGQKILLRNPNVKKGNEGYWEVEMDWDNGDFHLRQAYEGQILLDATSPDSQMLNNVRTWRYDFLMPDFDSGKTLSKDNFYSTNPKTGKRVYSASNLRKFIDGKKTKTNEYSDYRVRLFRRFEYEIQNGELVRVEKNLRDADKMHITSMMKQYSQLLEVTPGRKVHTAGTSKTAGYDDMLFRSQKYFNYANNFQDVIFKNLYYSQEIDPINGGTHYKFQGSNTNLNAKDLREYYNYKSDYIYTDKNTGNAVYSKYKKSPTTSPFPRGVVESMQKIAKGETGGVVERMLYKIYNEDPLNALHSETRVLTNESYVREMKLVNELLNNDGFDVSEMNNFIPRLIGQVKHDTGVIKRLKFQEAMVSKSRARNKTQKLRQLNSEIKALEQKLEPLLTKEYKKYKKAKDIGRFDFVEIQNDRNIINGTVSYYTLDHLNKYNQVVAPGKMKEDLLNHRIYIGKNYGNLQELHGLGYKRRSIYGEETQRLISETKTSRDIEMTSEQMLTKGVTEHGLSYLWSFAMPSVDAIANKIGVFNGNAMPVAIKPSGNYARAIRWLLKGKAGLLPAEIYQTTPKESFENILKSLAEVDFTWRRFFSGTSKHLPQDVAEMNKLLTYGAPKWHWKMNSLFQKYTDIKIDKPVDEFNPFGMGRKYDMNIAFFRSLANVDRATNGREFDKGASILSYTNQLMMENGYMTPQKHLALMSDITTKLGPAMKQVFPNQVDVNTGKVQPLKPFDMLSNPLYVLLGGGTGLFGHGLSLDPWKSMGPYEKNSVNRMMNQVKDMKDIERNHWKESFFETNIRQDINKKSGDC